MRLRRARATAAPAGGRRRALGAALLVAALAGGAVAQGQAVVPVGKVEAAFLRNFARYVNWPAQAFASERAAWVVCVLGGEHFDDSLEQTFLGRTEQGRPFTVLRVTTPEQLRSCQIAFIADGTAARRRSVLKDLSKLPVLTVGNAPEFLQEGGVIRLLAREQVEMSVNLDQARAVSLAIPTKMLEVSREVMEGGVVRKWR